MYEYYEKFRKLLLLHMVLAFFCAMIVVLKQGDVLAVPPLYVYFLASGKARWGDDFPSAMCWLIVTAWAVSAVMFVAAVVQDQPRRWLVWSAGACGLLGTLVWSAQSESMAYPLISGMPYWTLMIVSAIAMWRRMPKAE